MKAFLLAAGLGTRLKPITDKIPKCLVKVCDKPLLGWWIELMERHGITDVLINLHAFPDQVINYVASKRTLIKFNYYRENRLLGSGGTLRENKSFVEDEDEFFVFYGDNLTNYDLSEFLYFHRNHGQPFSMALFKTEMPASCGIASLDSNSIITDFEEKPKHPKSNLANAGIYLASASVLDLIPDYELTDIGFHLLPKLVNKMAGWQTDEYLIDIGTLENLERANREWSQIFNKQLRAYGI